MLRYILFDLDDTLYPSSSGLWDAIGLRINQYMVERLGLAPGQVPVLRDRYFRAFGTTLNGLRHDYHIDAQEYLNFVHDLPLDDYLQPDPALNGMLARLPLTKAIFTNSDAAHASRVLERLNVSRHFKHIVDIHALDFENKPNPAAYTRALQIVGASAAECVFVEDMRRNLLPARALGMLTVLVGQSPAGESTDGVDYQVPNVLDVERLLAGLIGQVW